MKKPVLLVVVLLIAILTKAQSPAYIWGKAICSDSMIGCLDIKKDGAGNVYTIGYFNQTVDFDPGAGTANLTTVGLYDIYISKLDASGNYVWARKLSGSYYGYGYTLAIDAAGNVYAAGVFSGTMDFDPGAGTSNMMSALYSDAFILKLDAGGNFKWVKRLEATSQGAIFSMTIDGKGNLYANGYFAGKADFDPGVDSFMMTSSSNYADVFVLKLDAAGNFKWAKVMYGNQAAYPYSIVTDASGNVFSCGYYYGTVDFNPGAGTAFMTSKGNEDIFIFKLDSMGNYVWATGLGGAGTDAGRSLAVDATGNVYTTGSFFGTVDFDPGAATSNLISFGSNDAFISKLDAAGNFVWARKIGGTLTDGGSSIKLDVSGNIFLTGSFIGTADFDPGAGSYNLTSAGLTDAFIAKLDASGSFVWTKKMGGTGEDGGTTMALDGSNAIYTTGWFSGTMDFDPGVGTDTIRAKGVYGVYIHKLSQSTSDLIESTHENNVVVYPNPGNGIFNVILPSSANDFHLEVYNNIGVLVYEKSTPDGVCTVDLNNYASGLYLLKVISDGHVTAIHKMIKE